MLLCNCSQVTKVELMEVASIPFLVDLGVVPIKKNPRENIIRADLFYKIIK